MCTLTYRLTPSGYELFFNRDEQRSRAQALPPQVDNALNAIYPVDPIGQGTWLAVHKSGLSLALLNYYQAEQKASSAVYISRGEIILKLLTRVEKGGGNSADNIFEHLKELPLHSYQSFQLCVFVPDLNCFNNQLRCFQWNGQFLTEQQQSLPITSSGLDYPQVYQARRTAFQQIVTAQQPTTKQLLAFHQYQQKEGKLSVKMFREDAQTVSFSHISVTQSINFKYLDYLDEKQYLASLYR